MNFSDTGRGDAVGRVMLGLLLLSGFVTVAATLTAFFLHDRFPGGPSVGRRVLIFLGILLCPTLLAGVLLSVALMIDTPLLNGFVLTLSDWYRRSWLIYLLVMGPILLALELYLGHQRRRTTDSIAGTDSER